MNNNHIIATQIMGLVEGVDFGNLGEHEWRKTKSGEIDTFAFSYGYCNGPVCVKCGYSYCEHCKDGPDEPCEIDLPDYGKYDSDARCLLAKLAETYDYEVVENKDGFKVNLRKGQTVILGVGDTFPLAVSDAALTTID